MTVQTLIRLLSDHNPRSSVYINKDVLAIGEDFFVRVPTKAERDVEKLYENLNGVAKVR